MTDSFIVTMLRSPTELEPHIRNAAADEIERLRAERDEARREVCSLQPFAHHNDGIAKDHAAYRKWDCFKENA